VSFSEEIGRSRIIIATAVVSGMRQVLNTSGNLEKLILNYKQIRYFLKQIKYFFAFCVGHIGCKEDPKAPEAELGMLQR
jgi:hypothetical protein